MLAAPSSIRRMEPARRPPDRRGLARLLTIDARTGALGHRTIGDLPELCEPGDLLVVNDAATLPAMLVGSAAGQAIEVRLLARGSRDDRWTAVLFGAGDWRTPTEHRPAPPIVAAGDLVRFDGLSAVIERVRPESARLVELRFDRREAALWLAIYRIGKPVQYSYLENALDLWSVQTPYAARPWAVELPSAGWSLGVTLLEEIRRRGVGVASLTHAAGLSSTGDAALDAALPLAERFDIPAATVTAVARTRGTGGRIIAIGTTVVRALEGSAAGGPLPHAGEGETTLRLGPGYRPSVVDGLVSGMHAPGESHYQLLRAFAPDDLLERATREAGAHGYRCHEFGDLTLTIK